MDRILRGRRKRPDTDAEFCFPFPLYLVVATEQLKRTFIVLIAARYSSAKVTWLIDQATCFPDVTV